MNCNHTIYLYKEYISVVFLTIQMLYKHHLNPKPSPLSYQCFAFSPILYLFLYIRSGDTN